MRWSAIFESWTGLYTIFWESPSDWKPRFLVIIVKGHDVTNLIEMEFQTHPLESHNIACFEYAAAIFESWTGLYTIFWESPSDGEPRFLVIIFKGHGVNNLIEMEFQTYPLESHNIACFEYTIGHFWILERPLHNFLRKPQRWRAPIFGYNCQRQWCKQSNRDGISSTPLRKP